MGNSMMWQKLAQGHTQILIPVSQISNELRFEVSFGAPL